MKKTFLILCSVLIFSQIQAQQGYDWHEPERAEGICQIDTAHIFNRLPGYMEELVRKPVWGLSKNTAGEFLHFKTTARSITIRYIAASKNFAMPHMPATGVSGLDLYAMDMNGNWNWSPPRYDFGDTVVFSYKNLQVATNNPMADFYVYLPLYNSVKWLSIGVPHNEEFRYAAPGKEKPIVAYGTSILQGAVASRTGLAWTSILGRNINREVINLGFSGNGRFEKPIFDLMAKTDAALYILDCMPNLTKGYADELVEQRVLYGIQKLREAHPEVPIILTGHADGYMPFNMDSGLINNYHRTSLVIAKIYQRLKDKGYKAIYLLSDKEIGFDINSTTEGTHANDIGMMKYAVAYEKLIRKVLNEPKGDISTEIPVVQSRDGYDWINRHEEVIKNTAETDPKVMLFGNSIINYWGGMPKAEKGIARGELSWQKYMQPLGVQNAGFGWDRIENVLWRIYHGELTEFKGDKIIVMIGTNNLGINTDEEIVNGLQFLLEQMHIRKPDAAITMVGILPRKGMEDRVDLINQKIKKMALGHHFLYADFSKGFLTAKSINAALFMGDGLHPNEKGYEVLGTYLNKIIK